MIEKRAFERTPVNLKALFRRNASEVFDTRVTDISMGGLFIKTPEYAEVGSKITVDMDSENTGQIIGVYGQIVRSTESGTAIKFIRTNESDLARLIDMEKLIAAKIKQNKRVFSTFRH